MDNIELNIKREIKVVESSKTKFFFIGAFIGVLPYLILFSALNNNLNERILFRNTLIIFTIGSVFINGFIISRTVYRRYKDFMEFKYDTNYDELKKNFN